MEEPLQFLAVTPPVKPSRLREFLLYLVNSDAGARALVPQLRRRFPEFIPDPRSLEKAEKPAGLDPGGTIPMARRTSRQPYARRIARGLAGVRGVSAFSRLHRTDCFFLVML